jgi:hypothetical protein
MVDHERLTAMLVEFANTLVSDYKVGEILDRLCGAAVEVLPASGAGVMLADELGDLRFVAASDEVVRRIEALQMELGEGPCLHSFVSGEQVVIADLGDTDWFPRFAPRARAEGMHAVYSFPMTHGPSPSSISSASIPRTTSSTVCSTTWAAPGPPAIA